ncbi:Endoplasmic reticulum oxidoreductin 1 [Corchorus capsularis]|uniref:Endoplasmic reticulum oxidoreductin 1 n=1 Tax=Corchorus capsularis TaxID=210143 RepID=A0A1R3J4G0_COCAP|nr:Endoplasmic reticulum oxidoreductin 1 [Corchorus capsularis]
MKAKLNQQKYPKPCKQSSLDHPLTLNQLGTKYPSPPPTVSAINRHRKTPKTQNTPTNSTLQKNCHALTPSHTYGQISSKFFNWPVGIGAGNIEGNAGQVKWNAPDDGCKKCRLWGKLQVLGLGTANFQFSVNGQEHLGQKDLWPNGITKITIVAVTASKVTTRLGIHYITSFHGRPPSTIIGKPTKNAQKFTAIPVKLRSCSKPSKTN